MNEEFLKAQLEDLVKDLDRIIGDTIRDYRRAGEQFERASSADNLPLRILKAGEMQYFSGAEDAYRQARDFLTEIIEKVWS